MIGVMNDQSLLEHFRTLKQIAVMYHTPVTDLYTMPILDVYWLFGVMT